MQVCSEYVWDNKRGFIMIMLRMLVLALVLYVGLSAVVVFVGTTLGVWPDTSAGMTEAFANMSAWWEGNPLAAMGVYNTRVAMFNVVFFFSLFLSLSGVFGISKEVVESAGTFAETIISWIKMRLVPFLFAALVVTLVGIVPAMAIGLVFPMSLGTPLPSPYPVFVGAFMFTVIFFTLGMTIMIFPAMAAGRPLVAGLKEGIGLTLDNFVAVFSRWALLLVMLALWPLPRLVWNEVTSGATPQDMAASLLSAWGILYGCAVLFFLLPLMTLVLSRLYARLTGNQVY